MKKILSILVFFVCYLWQMRNGGHFSLESLLRNKPAA